MVAALGAIVLVATGIRTTFQIHENWIEENRMRYDIERKAALFLVGASPYQGPDAAGSWSSESSSSPTAAGIDGLLDERGFASRRKPLLCSLPRLASRASRWKA